MTAETQFDYPSHWLKEQIALTKAQLRRCERAMELIQNKNSLYSKGHWVMVAAHTKALAVYEAELSALDVPEKHASPVPCYQCGPEDIANGRCLCVQR